MRSTFDSPDKLLQYAAAGRLPKQALARLLGTGPREDFLEVCADIERHYTEECAATEPCLPSGCSAEGEVCLQPLLRAGTEYFRACGQEWGKLFARAENRSSDWEREASTLVQQTS